MNESSKKQSFLNKFKVAFKSMLDEHQRENHDRAASHAGFQGFQCIRTNDKAKNDSKRMTTISQAFEHNPSIPKQWNLTRTQEDKRDLI